MNIENKNTLQWQVLGRFSTTKTKIYTLRHKSGCISNVPLHPSSPSAGFNALLVESPDTALCGLSMGKHCLNTHFLGKSDARYDTQWSWLRWLEYLLARPHTFQLSKDENHAEIPHHIIALGFPSSLMRTIYGTQRKVGGKMSLLHVHLSLNRGCDCCLS